MQTKNKSVKKHCYVMTVEKEQKLKDQDYLFVQTSVSRIEIQAKCRKLNLIWVERIPSLI